MGRYYWDKKDIVEDTRSLDIDWLMREGKYKKGNSYYGRKITWTRSGAWGERKNSISYSIDLTKASGPEMRIYYTTTDRHTEEKKDFDYRILLTTTPCNFGGVRYWFLCPNQNCRKRVGRLYFGQKLFLCRQCLNLSYESRNLGGVFKAMGKVISVAGLDKMEAKIKRKYYHGKMTKRYKRFLSLEEKSTLQMQIVSEALGSRL